MPAIGYDIKLKKQQNKIKYIGFIVLNKKVIMFLM
jgi:hypothetical protein|tara:strand:+ start:3413 stop:3517 length:105 start_codon:yes stop_codon:yes gene_type:complete